MDELAELATAGAEVAGRVIQNAKAHPDICGEGKLLELKEVLGGQKQPALYVMTNSHPCSSDLERELSAKVISRTLLILDICSQGSQQRGEDPVELAQRAEISGGASGWPRDSLSRLGGDAAAPEERSWRWTGV